MSAIQVSQRYLASQYTGANGTAVVADAGGVLVSDNGSTLVLTINDIQYSVPSGQWLVWSSNGATNNVADIIPTAEYQGRYVPIPRPSAVGAEDVPALLLGANADVDITLSRAMAGTSYDVESWLVGAHATLTKNATSIVDESTVRVNVSTGLAYTAGAQVLVAAHGQVA